MKLKSALFGVAIVIAVSADAGSPRVNDALALAINHVVHQSPTPTAATEVVAVSAVPEPAAWALMLSGFGVVGGALRRQRRSAAAP